MQSTHATDPTQFLNSTEVLLRVFDGLLGNAAATRFTLPEPIRLFLDHGPDDPHRSTPDGFMRYERGVVLPVDETPHKIAYLLGTFEGGEYAGSCYAHAIAFLEIPSMQSGSDEEKSLFTAVREGLVQSGRCLEPFYSVVLISVRNEYGNPKYLKFPRHPLGQAMRGYTRRAFELYSEGTYTENRVPLQITYRPEMCDALIQRLLTFPQIVLNTVTRLP
jgi:hypothetical protein